MGKHETTPVPYVLLKDPEYSEYVHGRYIDETGFNGLVTASNASDSLESTPVEKITGLVIDAALDGDKQAVAALDGRSLVVDQVERAAV
jgi:hypothetical protein